MSNLKIIFLLGAALSFSGSAFSQAFDVDAAPKTLAPASMPAGATASGKCDISFDVDIEGAAKNIKAKACTDEIFYLASIRAIQKSSFAPATKAGQPVIREGVIHPVQFTLLDEAGNPVPVSIANLYYPPEDEIFSPKGAVSTQNNLASVSALTSIDSGGGNDAGSDREFTVSFTTEDTMLDRFQTECLAYIIENQPLNLPERACEIGQRNLQRITAYRNDEVTTRFYDEIANADENSRIFEEEIYKGSRQTILESNRNLISADFGKLLSPFATKAGKNVNLEAFDNLTISYETIGWNFTFSESDGYWSTKRFEVNEYLRYTVQIRGEIVYDVPLVVRSITLGERADCSLVKKRRNRNRCLEQYSSADWASKEITNIEQYIGYHFAGARSIHASLFGKAPSVLIPYFDYIGTKYGEVDKMDVAWIVRKEKANSPGFHSVVDTHASNNLPELDFTIIDGAKAKLELRKLNLLKDAPRLQANYGSNPRYAGDVQRCIVEVRNSMRSDQATGSVLSGLARLAGAGTAADILDTTNRAINTYDNLNGTERKEVDACMRRKGH